MGFQLRPYQETALDGVRAAYRDGVKRVLLVAPTGAGKSAMMRFMIGNTKMRVLILVHRQELLEMVGNDLSMPYSVIAPGKPTPRHGQVHIGMMQTVARRLADLIDYDWIISDEAHLAMCPTWQSILDHFKDKWHLGMSATPCRLDGKGLGMSFDKIIYGPTIKELTARGFLVPCRVYAPPTPLTTVKKHGAEFSMADAAAQMDRASIIGDAVKTYLRFAAGKQFVAFCCTREHAEHVASLFTQAGIPTAAIDGTMDAVQRRVILADYRARKYMGLTCVELLTTGWDCPQVECGIFYRPTDSLALFLQMIGRVLRICPAINKREAIVLDHVGNTSAARHGLPWIDREWTLDGSAPRRASATNVRVCPECYRSHEPCPTCPSCGHAYAAAPRAAAPKTRRGELVERTQDGVDPGGLQSRSADLKTLLKQVRTREDLKVIAKARGYHHRWVTRMAFMKRLPDRDMAA